MHIGFLLPEYPHEKLPRAAGIGTSTKNMILAMIKKGIRVTIFTCFQNAQEVFQDGAVTIHKIKLRRLPPFTWKLNAKIINKYINKVIKKDNIDVIEVVDWIGISADLNFSIPQIMRLHGSDTFFCHLDGRPVKKVNFNREYKAFTKANKIIGVSKFVAEKSNTLFETNRNIEIIPNGIFTDDFKPFSKTKMKSNNLLYFGTIIRKKGVLELAQAFNIVVEKNSEATLTLLGKDATDIYEKVSTMKLFMQQLSEKAKKQINHVPQVPYDKVKDFLAEATVIVLPSFAEALPMTWIEAMASGKSLVTSDIGWANEIMIHEKTGYMVPPTNHELFAKYMLELLQNETQRTTFGEYARKIALDRFDITKIADQNIATYQTLIKN